MRNFPPNSLHANDSFLVTACISKNDAPANRISQILAGKRGVTADTALRLGQWLGTGPEIWLNLQKAYELRLAQAKTDEEIKRTIPTRAPVLAASLHA